PTVSDETGAPRLKIAEPVTRARWQAIAGRDRDGRAAVEGACGWLLTRSDRHVHGLHRVDPSVAPAEADYHGRTTRRRSRRSTRPRRTVDAVLGDGGWRPAGGGLFPFAAIGGGLVVGT